MPENKTKKTKLQITFSALLLALIFIIELYAMINLPGNFLVIGIVGVLFLGCLYILIAGVLSLGDAKRAREEEQYDSIFKSEKASYLMLKKYFEEIEDKLVLLEKISKVPTEEIVGTQKGIGKVIINRSRENAEAILSSNDILVERIDALEKMIGTNNTSLVDQYKSIGEDQIQKILMKQSELIMELKDMEIRLDNAIMQSQKIVAAAAPVMTAAPVMAAPVTQPVTPVAEEPIEPVAVAESIAMTEPVLEPEPIMEDSIPAEPEPMVTAPLEDAVPAAEEITEAIPAAEEISADDSMTDEEIGKLLDDVLGDLGVSEEEKTPPMPDLSDPNKMMSPDDIAALLANMSDNTPEPEADDAVADIEPIGEADVTLEPEVSVEETDTGADAGSVADVSLSDPNKQLRPDEIAALFASMS
ncbi:MAG: hypothetical protein PUB52_06480 [Lachnospiraceae bacterium]|nr:hypothetical protein [Lachnospiraceae bacterium]